MDKDIEASVASATGLVAMLGMIVVLFGYLHLGLLLVAAGGAVHISSKAQALIAFLVYGLLYRLR